MEEKKIIEIRIKDMLLRCIIGVYDWERKNKQDIIVNIFLQYDASSAILSDQIEDAYNYKALSKKITQEVEESSFFLIEKLADFIIQIIMEDARVIETSVCIEKPHALRYSKSVSVTLTSRR